VLTFPNGQPCTFADGKRCCHPFSRSIDHGQYVIQLHVWRSQEGASFATFIFEKAGEWLLRHFTGSDEYEVIRQALAWCDENS
jgi:hypothetical protein